ncbi:MAG TPA: cytochrome b/b6 domain-containing protein [Allosphingosinicella sp.]|nr:cytochrome b/b6 domain-containing protein [Allosphingosinicella sp.]
MASADPGRRLRIWDLPTRIFHWLLVVLLPFQWWTAEEDRLDLHVIGGLLILALLVFRIFWGLFGSSTARFANFVKGPRAIISYLHGRSANVIGHNALGAVSVVALLGLLSIEVTLGLFAGDEDGLESGPLSHLIDTDLSETMADLHEDAFDVLLVLTGLHIAAILFYALIRRKNLVGPMVTGWGRGGKDAVEMERAPLWRFLIALVAAVAIALWVRAGAPL